MSAHTTTTERGFLVSGREWKIIGGASALMALNVLVMYVLAATPLAGINDLLFSVPILGVLLYGVAIGGGELLAERGVEGGSMGLAAAGTGILQGAFGLFGAGVLAVVAPGSRLTVLGITAVVVAAMTTAIGLYVYARSTTFEHYGRWSTYAFLGGLAAILVGTFVSAVLVVGFVLIFAGFILRLGYEIWQIRDGKVQSTTLQAIGLYVAVAGVFVHVLQIVVRMLARR